MRSSNKADSARIVCLGLFLLCSLKSAPAQVGPSSESQAIASTESAGTIYKVPGLSDAAQSSSASGPALTGNFFQRLGKFYVADWTDKLPGSSSPRRMLDAPLESPPFPSSDWGYGGPSPIGVPHGGVYPLMTALGKQNSRSKIFGWISGSINTSTSSTNNFPVAYDIFPNRPELNQAVIYVERLPNTVQKEHFDWGYHLTALYGIDYRF